MQILFVLGILGLSLFTIDSLNTSNEMNSNERSIYKMQSDNLEVSWKLSQFIRRAYDRGLEPTAACPAGTTPYNPIGTAGVRLCFGNELRSNCFEGIVGPLQRDVCLRNGFQRAATPRATTYGTYSGFTNPSPNPAPTASGPAAAANGAFVILPQANVGNQVNTNHIDCRRNHTECFTVVFCIDGSTNCNNQRQLIQTYATRNF